ncbi:hypothetical protein D9M69_591710 [compost metagenome]
MPRVAFGDGIYGKKAKMPAFAQKSKGAQEEVGYKIGTASPTFGNIGYEPVAIFCAGHTSDALSTQERWITYESIEPPIFALEYLRKLNCPMEGKTARLTRGKVD